MSPQTKTKILWKFFLQGIVKQALSLVKALSGNDEVKVAVVTKGGMELILAAMTKHQANATIAELGCGNIGKIVLRNPTHCARVIDCQGHQVILQAMKIHIKDENVQVYMLIYLHILLNFYNCTREHERFLLMVLFLHWCLYFWTFWHVHFMQCPLSYVGSFSCFHTCIYDNYNCLWDRFYILILTSSWLVMSNHWPCYCTVHVLMSFIFVLVCGLFEWR